MNNFMKKFFIVMVMFMCATMAVKAQDKFITHCTITTYNPTNAQTDDSPLVTANGTKICPKKLKEGKLKYVAVSRDLRWCLPYGSIIHIEGHGLFEVVDTMHPRFDHYIDILQHESQPNFKKEKIKVTLIKKPKKK